MNLHMEQAFRYPSLQTTEACFQQQEVRVDQEAVSISFLDKNAIFCQQV